MARPKQPTALHDVKGSYTRNPQRRNKGEPQPKRGIGPAPDHLDEHQRAVWDELVGIVCPGVLGDSDRWTVEICVRLMAKLRSPEGVSGVELSRLTGLLASLGMTPSDRSKITVSGTDDKENPAAKFF